MIKHQEITELIKKRIENFTPLAEISQTGNVIEAGDGIARVYGLSDAVYGEIVQFKNGVQGIVLNLEETSVGCVLLGEESLVKEGDTVKRTGRVADVPCGDAMIGRVVNALGEPLDGRGDIKTDTRRPVEIVAPSIIKRMPVKEPLQTGIKPIDALIPIGRGQRELIIGDRQTGKTAIAVDAIINQKNNPKGKDVICIYTAIGQKQSTTAKVIKTLEEAGAMDYSVVVSASSAEPAPLLYLAPYSACAIAEHFLWQGKDVLIIYDDLTKHAQAYRQMSLLLRRPPGREAYPGDVFYLHSRLLERACKLNKENGGGSITALPIIETQAGDVSAYIPTNVISITDGQIYLENGLFHAGIRPAVNVGLSVSRVGGSAQPKAMRQVAGRLRLDLAQYYELAAFAQFGADLDKDSKEKLERGKRMVELLKQAQYSPMPAHKQVISIFAGVNGFLDEIPAEDVPRFEREILNFLEVKKAELMSKLKDASALDDEMSAEIKSALKEFLTGFKKTKSHSGDVI